MIAVRLEGANGFALVDAEYDKPVRPFRIPYSGQWFEQSGTEGAVWIYRQRETPLGTMPDDPALVVSSECEISALIPASATIGDPNFTLHVEGMGFDGTAVIVFAGQDEPTTLVSSEEVTTGVDMSVWLGADPAIPVFVRNGAGVETQTLLFAMLAASKAATKTAWPMPGWDTNG